MSKVPIVVDSTAYIPEDLIKKHHIHVIPQILTWEGQSLLDGVEITPEQFYKRLQSASEIPTTSQPSAGAFADFFKKVGEEADSIVAILVSDHLSGTLDSARSAVDLLENIQIEIVDSLSTSMGLGWIVLAAARAVEQGKSAVEVAQLARDLVSKSRIIFVVDTLEYLHKGGRIGGAQRLMGSVLAIKPLLHLEDGRIEPLASVRTKKNAVEQMLDVIEEEIKDKKTVRMATVNALASEEAKELGKMLQARFQPFELLHAELSPAIGTHVGPGTIGVAYITED
ncbi:MAG: DegV family protein [Anaerolineales bacterium]|nr:DegV family protein [Anaerolineales bacterium]